jgi:UDP-N-acetylglucosamine 2-epimerase
LLFCPTDAAVENLAKEGIKKGVHRVGDVMADTLFHNLELARTKSKIIDQLGLEKGQYALATVHRASNTDDEQNMRSILSAFGKLSSRVVFPVHPRTRKMMQEWGISVSSNVTMIEPVGHFDMLTLQKNANCILTDSGGVQKEAYLVGVRCITLREETEWVETVDAGWNRLAGVDVKKILDSFESWFPQTERVPLYGDGHASEQIFEILSSTLK